MDNPYDFNAGLAYAIEESIVVKRNAAKIGANIWHRRTGPRKSLKTVTDFGDTSDKVIGNIGTILREITPNVF